MNDHSILPPPEFPGLVGDYLPPGATRTGFIPATANLVTGDRFAFVMSGDRNDDWYAKISDVLPDMEGARIAVSAPAYFFEAQSGGNIQARYVVQRADGMEAISVTRSFSLGTSDDSAPSNREWYVADFQELPGGKNIPFRMAFMTFNASPAGTSITSSSNGEPPYIVGNSMFTPNAPGLSITFTFDFPVQRVRCGIRAYSSDYPVTAYVLDAQETYLASETITDTGWFDKSISESEIAMLRIDGNASTIDNISIFPAKPEEVKAIHLDENFESLPIDDGVEHTRLLPAWRVAAASGLIAIEDAVTGLSGHVLAIHQSLDDISTHYFTPRLTVSPGRVAIRLRTLSTLSATARVVAAYQVRSLLDATRHEIREVTIDGNSQIVELGGADPDEHLSYIAVTQTGGGATTLYYDDIKAT